MPSRNTHNIHDRIKQAFDDRPQEKRSEPSRRQAFINRCARCLWFVRPETTDRALPSAAQQVAKKSFSINHPCLAMPTILLRHCGYSRHHLFLLRFIWPRLDLLCPTLVRFRFCPPQVCIVTTGRIILGAARVACFVLLTRALFRVKIRWVSPLRPILLDATVERLTRRGASQPSQRPPNQAMLFTTLTVMAEGRRQKCVRGRSDTVRPILTRLLDKAKWTRRIERYRAYAAWPRRGRVPRHRISGEIGICNARGRWRCYAKRT